MNISDSDLQDEAAEWLVRLDAGTADEAAFEVWRGADPRRAVAFVQAQAAWEQMGAAPVGQSVPKPARDVPPGLSRRMMLKAASVAGPIVAVGGGAALLMGQGRAYAATAVGERYRFEAVPGLTVELNTDSRIGWRRSGKPREIWLEKGEAAILMEDASAGAILHCNGHRLLLTQGLYNIRARPVGGDLTVLEGAARVGDGAAGERSPIAADGKHILFGRGEPRIEPAPLKAVESISAWRRGEIVFDGESLSEAVAEYNRYLEQKLVVEDPVVARQRIGGRFETLRPRSFLAAVEVAFGFQAVSRGDEIILRKKPASE